MVLQRLPDKGEVAVAQVVTQLFWRIANFYPCGFHIACHFGPLIMVLAGILPDFTILVTQQRYEYFSLYATYRCYIILAGQLQIDKLVMGHNQNSCNWVQYCWAKVQTNYN